MFSNKENVEEWKEHNIKNSKYYYSSFNDPFLCDAAKRIKDVLIKNNYFLSYNDELYITDSSVKDVVDSSYSIENKISESRKLVDRIFQDQSSIFFREELYDVESLIKHTRTLCLDLDIYPWLYDKREPNEEELELSSLIIAERFLPKCDFQSIKKEKKENLKNLFISYLTSKGYKEVSDVIDGQSMERGTFCVSSTLFHVIVKPFDENDKKEAIFFDIRNGREYINLFGKKKRDGEKMKGSDKKAKRYGKYIIVLLSYFSPTILSSLRFCDDWFYEYELLSSLDTLEL